MEDIRTARIEKSIHFIESNLSGFLSLEIVAEHACISKYHFAREFKMLTGDKVGDYIRRRRITQSASDLISTEYPIVEIAEKYQFESQEAYTRSFKKIYQITPNNYRKNGVHQLAFKRNKLSSERVSHLQQNVSLQPEIVNLKGKMLVGIHCKTSSIQNNIPTLWKIFVRRKNEISSSKDNGLFGISGYSENHGFTPSKFSGSSMIEKWATLEVSDFKDIPEDMVTYNLTGGEYARFTHKGGRKNVQMSFEYIYSVWLPNSIYDLDNRDHFEHYPKDYKGPDNPSSELHIFIPIKPKTRK